MLVEISRIATRGVGALGEGRSGGRTNPARIRNRAIANRIAGAALPGTDSSRSPYRIQAAAAAAIAEPDNHTRWPESIPGPGSVGYRGFRRGIRRRYRKRHGVEQGKCLVPFDSK